MKKTLFLSFLLSCTMAQAQETVPTDSWLARISDTARVAELLIPGAHDAATGEGFADNEAQMYAVTQDVPLALQFESGIRAFDLRPVMHGDTLWVAHGRYTTRTTFHDALATIIHQLEQHPTEFAIILVRNENDTEHGQGTWQQLMANELARIETHLATFRPDISVGEMRGKLLFFSRDAYNEPVRGAMIDNWADMTEHSTTPLRYPEGETMLTVQDYYETVGAKQEIKSAAICQLLDLSAEEKSHGNTKWIFNYASGYALTDSTGYSLSAGYRANAEATSAAIHTYINMYKGATKPAGVVFIDFAGVDMSAGYKVNGLQLTRELIGNFD